MVTLNRRWTWITIAAMFAAIIAIVCSTGCKDVHVPGVITLEAQTLPLTVKLGVDPDSAAMGYFVALDGGAQVDQGLPATKTCVEFVGGATSTCVPLSVTIPTAGVHTAVIMPYNISGNGGTVSVVINVTTPPGNPTHGRIIK